MTINNNGFLIAFIKVFTYNLVIILNNVLIALITKLLPDLFANFKKVLELK